MMGANTDRMGAWAGEDVEYSASFATREERDIADWKVFKERISEMGVYGCYMQAVRKTLTNYNDGTFAWWQEGGFVAYPHEDISNIDVKIKSVYNIEEEGGYNNNKWSNIMQCIWLTILLSLIFVPINKISCYDKQILVAMLAILGLSLFEIIFECRARYLYSYSPIYVILATIGICSIVEFICLKRGRNMIRKKPRLFVIIPCYNEEAVLPITSGLFLDELIKLITKDKITEDSRIMFVNDGSKDGTWNIIQELSESDEHFIGISQSRNRGHQNAVLAGLMESKDNCDITISIDCDGQDDIGAMEEMVEEYMTGSEVVYGVRKREIRILF